MIPANLIRPVLSEVLRDGVSGVARSSLTAAAFSRRSSRIPRHVLERHAVEHVFRIRMFRRLDALAKDQLDAIDSSIAETWGNYARSEAVHDRYFLRDLATMGVGRAAVEAASPFQATVRLGDFIESAAGPYGPLPVILYSFWAEQNSEVGSPPIVARARQVFGAPAVKGATAHMALDRRQDHVSVIAQILEGIVRDPGDLTTAARLLDVITNFIGAYFLELDHWSKPGGAEHALGAA